MPDCSLESRHLGLITAAEVNDLKEKMQRLAAKAQETIDLNALLQIAKSAPPLTFTPPDIPWRASIAHRRRARQGILLLL